jgi:hypothetical protein
MTHGDGFDERLRERFVEPPRGAPSRLDCPEAERISRAARGEAPFDEVQAILDHLSACAACTVAWRLARESAVAEGEPVRAQPSTVASWRRPVVRYAAAAVVLVAVAGIAVREWSRRSGDDAGFRTTGEAAIRAAIPDGGELPRGAFLLRWTPGPAGTRYTVLVSDERLTPITEGANVGSPEFLVPEEALTALPSGARVLWQVRATLPDGTRVATQTFVARVADPVR